MKYVFLTYLLLMGCTFKIDTRTDEQVLTDENTMRNEKLVRRCNNMCAPFIVAAFIAVEQRCICSAEHP